MPMTWRIQLKNRGINSVLMTWRAISPRPYCAVHRNENTYSLAVSNAGDGLEYHPQEADPLLDGFRAMHTVQLDDIEPGVLLDGSSWALLYRPLIFPAPGRKQAETIYAKVLPFLNKRPLMASVGHAGMAAVGRSNASNPLSVLAGPSRYRSPRHRHAF